MLRWLQVILIAICLSSCAHISQVNVDTALGDEIRPGNNRQSAVIGTTTKLNSGVKVKVQYRHRLTDFDYAEQEHGFFIGVSIPVWKRP